MEERFPKKLWKMIQLVCIMLRKGISKPRVLSDLGLMIKRRVTGKQGDLRLMFDSGDPVNSHATSCSSTPSFDIPSFHLLNSRNPARGDFLAAAIEIVTRSASASPGLPVVNTTGSPLTEIGMEEDSGVDEAAEEFILRFYKGLMQQNDTAS